ncbi:MAG TPA: GxxExxY protein [Caulobacteraceae bacterium]|jgi:GxxExxY protein
MNHEAHKAHEELGEELEAIARAVVDAGFNVHNELGPGLLESTYEHCLTYELVNRGLSVRRQVGLPVLYKGLQLDAGYRLDMLVAEQLVLEVKVVDALTRVHQSQLMTYLKLSGFRLGFLMKFNVSLFKEGVRRIVM